MTSNCEFSTVNINSYLYTKLQPFLSNASELFKNTTKQYQEEGNTLPNFCNSLDNLFPLWQLLSGGAPMHCTGIVATTVLGEAQQLCLMYGLHLNHAAALATVNQFKKSTIVINTPGLYHVEAKFSLSTSE